MASHAQAARFRRAVPVTVGTAGPSIAACSARPRVLILWLLCGTQANSMPHSLPRVDVGALVPLPGLETQCGKGFGVAPVCPTLALLAASNSGQRTIGVFALVTLGAHAGYGVEVGPMPGLSHVATLGGADAPAPMQFQFQDDGGSSGWMAFTGPSTSRLLLVTDAGHDVVHLIDVACRAHVGFLAEAGAIPGPRGVAARGSLVAVSAWKQWDSGDHVPGGVGVPGQRGEVDSAARGGWWLRGSRQGSRAAMVSVRPAVHW
jgi:hypothetical protein